MKAWAVSLSAFHGAGSVAPNSQAFSCSRGSKRALLLAL